MKTIKHLSIAILSLALSNAVMAVQATDSSSSPGARNAGAKSPKASRLAAPAMIPPASPEQIDAAEHAHFGDYECEFNQKIHVSLHARHAGYIEVKHRNRIFVMRPVLSSTGALRLEDVRGQTLLLQIANKSMLMDVNAGKRIVDSCIHSVQNDFNRTAPTATSVLN